MRRQVRIKDTYIGGDAPILVQSMCNTDPCNVEAVVCQLREFYDAGCDIARLAVPDEAAAEAFARIRKVSPLPLVADIHFAHRLALSVIRGGADKVRINPGNIGGKENVRAVAEAAKAAGIPIRIGVNSGSIEKDILARDGGPTAEGMVESAFRHAEMLEDNGFSDIVISLKASDVRLTVESYRLLSKKCDYPLHVGVTEAGTAYSGLIKSSAGIGALLLDGIGDTIRYSLTADPVEEVTAGIALLKSLNLRKGARLISCPTCGRTKIDLIPIANEMEKRLANVKKDITVAVMGCIVNGPGEARHADIGIAGGDQKAALFRKGEVLRTVHQEDIVTELMKEIEQL